MSDLIPENTNPDTPIVQAHDRSVAIGGSTENTVINTGDTHHHYPPGVAAAIFAVPYPHNSSFRRTGHRVSRVAQSVDGYFAGCDRWVGGDRQD